MNRRSHEKVFELGGAQVVVRFEVADRRDPDLGQTILQVDLQTFAESTFSTHSARALAEHGIVFVIKTGNETIGTCVAVRSWEDPDEALLLSMGILPGWRGRGLGQFLVRAVLDALGQRGLRSASLQVDERNRRAVMLYRELGFEVVGDSVPSSGRQNDVLRMSVRLDGGPTHPSIPTVL